ncbi:hypothetical protein [uncultured Serinicoccus sp.]|uniref:hypothetical protein n=1 Tax=uncultured Serinicoccus sp. TaxID=735514 RepID=UPI00261B5BC8|nr:hypothetical protein [uncultured Serinicoccus sp.]
MAARAIARHNGRRSDAGTNSASPPGPVGWPRAGGALPPYKTAIAAFYALCLGKGADSALQYFNQDPLILNGSELIPSPSEAQLVTMLQALGFFIWISLFFISNVHLYLSTPSARPSLRVLSYVVLAAAFIAFYFFAATIGSPSRAQLGPILAILALDTIYPLSLGGLSMQRRLLWVGRGIAQSAAIAVLFSLASNDDLERWWWAVLFAGVMIIQLVIIAPLETRLHASGSE